MTAAVENRTERSESDDSGELAELSRQLREWWSAQQAVVQDEARLLASRARLAVTGLAAVLCTAIVTACLILSSWILAMVALGALLEQWLGNLAAAVAIIAGLNLLAGYGAWRLTCAGIAQLGRVDKSLEPVA